MSCRRDFRAQALVFGLPERRGAPDDRAPMAIPCARRRAARKLRWRVEKYRPHYNDRGGLMFVDQRNIVIAGDRYDLTPEEPSISAP